MVSDAMVRHLSMHIPVEVLVVQSSILERKFRRHFSKTLSAIRALFTLRNAKARGARLLYIAVDDGLGGLWAILFVKLARILGLKIFLHHHSYRYIEKRRLIMDLLVRSAGPDAHHIMLCDEMEFAFAKLYPLAKHFFVAPNSVDEVEAPISRRSLSRDLTIGMLSNLTFEKGVREFIEILERLRRAGLEVQGRLAGPAPSDDVAEFILAKQRELGGALDWKGPVRGDAKEQFFADIDLFVFPTRYRTESFGLVLLEALLRGIPVTAPRRGCICAFEPLEAAEIIPLDDNFEDRASTFITQLYDDPPRLARLSTSAASEGARLNAAHRSSQMALAAQMAREAYPG